jgi:hypothetical protein
MVLGNVQGWIFFIGNRISLKMIPGGWDYSVLIFKIV